MKNLMKVLVLVGVFVVGICQVLAFSTKELSVPYIRQVGDTANNFNGEWACGATSAVMITAFHGRLSKDSIWCTFCKPDHWSDYGKYVSEKYARYGYTFDESSPDASNNPAYGAYGYIHDDNGYAVATHARGYFRRHGLFSEVDNSPTEAEVKAEIDKGHPVWTSTKLWTTGHIVVIKGYTGNNYIVHDPWPNGQTYCYMGNDMQYTWTQMGSKWVVIADPIKPDDRIKALYNDIKIRSGPGRGNPEVASSRKTGDIGTIVDDPTYGCFYNSDTDVNDDHYTWWKIRWDNDNAVGWSACGDQGYGENWIEKVNIPPSITITSVEPSTVQTKDWGESVTYNITVKDENGNPVSGAIIFGDDYLQSWCYTTDPLTTNSSGQITYTTTVPNGKANGAYNITFTASKSGYPNSGMVTRQVQVNHITPNNPPYIPTNVNQYKSNGTTIISEGATTPESTVIFKGTVSDPDSDQVQLEIELRRIEELPFTGAPTWFSSLVSSGSQVTYTRGGLINASYRWQYRAKDSKGATSSWKEFGIDGNTDFTVSYVTDTTPPTPNPMTWSTPPQAVNSTSISMVATTATDNQSPPVYYNFDFVNSPTGGTGGADSAEQSSITYTNTGLQSNHQYGYRVRARDSASVPNWTSYSSPTIYKYTLANALGAAPFSNITQSSIQANWTANGNSSGTEYWCENTTKGTNFGWTANTYWNETGLTCGTSYTYRVKAKNGDGIETGWTNLGIQSTQACPVGVLSVTPLDGLTSSGNQGGSFTPSSKIYTLQNTGGSSINWTASKGQAWVTLSSTSGTLGAGANTTVTVSINSNANSLTPNVYNDTVSFTNTTNGNGNQTRPVSLTVNVAPPKGIEIGILGPKAVDVGGTTTVYAKILGTETLSRATWTITAGTGTLSTDKGTSTIFTATQIGTVTIKADNGTTATIIIIVGHSMSPVTPQTITAGFSFGSVTLFGTTAIESYILSQAITPVNLSGNIGGIGIEVNAYGSSGTKVATLTLYVEIGYNEGALGNIEEETLRLWLSSDGGNTWEEVIPSGVDTVRNIVYGTITHLSYIAPAGSLSFSPDLSKAFVYPNPYYANKHDGIYFDRLTENSTIKIFTIAGELVREIRVENSLQRWDVRNEAGEKVASGIYIYFIKDPAGNKKVGKLAVIR